jgi:hypothetical protein
VDRKADLGGNYSMLGFRGPKLRRVRRHRTAAPHVHGREEPAGATEEQHQLPPRALPEEAHGHDEEQLIAEGATAQRGKFTDPVRCGGTRLEGKYSWM